MSLIYCHHVAEHQKTQQHNECFPFNVNIAVGVMVFDMVSAGGRHPWYKKRT